MTGPQPQPGGGEDVTWVPEVCPRGHRRGVTLTFHHHVGCPWSEGGQGHQVAYCRVIGCRPPMIPPGCTARQDDDQGPGRPIL